MRRCQMPGCDISLEGRRRNTLYCSASHRARASEARKGVALATESVDRFWSGLASVVRPRSLSS